MGYFLSSAVDAIAPSAFCFLPLPMPRSIRIHPDHKQAVAMALERNGFLTQGDLAAHLEIALSTVSNFFRGVNVSVAKFEEITGALGLEPRELIQAKAVTALDSSESPVSQPLTFFAYDDAWVGRQRLVSALSARVRGDCRLLLLTGIAGVGKTALAERLTLELSGFSAVQRENFDAQDRATDFGSFAARLLAALGQVVTPDNRSDAQQLLNRLVQILKTSRCLILIDSLEELLQGDERQGWSEFKDGVFGQFFQRVLAAESFQSRLVVTSQELPTQLLGFGSRYQNVWFKQPLTGLSDSEQRLLFEKTGLDMRPDTESRSLLTRIGHAYEGHPLALRVITGEIGSRPFFGDVVAYWNRYGHEIKAVEQAIAEAAAGQAVGADDKWRLDRFTSTLRHNVRLRLEQTFERLRRDARLAYILLCEVSVYRCAVPEDWWLSHLDYWECEAEAAEMALDALRDRFLVEEAIESGQYTLRQHSLIRSVSLDHLKRLDAKL